jgi:pSer/pThr/pTyr-binding forkhead associated (FHA) protein
LTQGGWLLSAHSIVEIGDSITLEYLPTDIATGTSPPLATSLDIDDDKVYYLVIKQESLPQPEIYLLDRLTISMGRDVDNDIVLQEPEVSRHHMRMVLTEEGYAIEDLNTMNGTFVNDRRLAQQRVLRMSDRVRVGTRVQMWYTDNPDRLIENLRAGILDQEVDETLDTKTGHDSEVETTEMDETRSSTIDTGHGLEPNALVNSVFMAYAPEEWNLIIGKLYIYLEDNGVTIWAPQYLQPDTENWNGAIEQAQLESPCLLAIVSEKSLELSHVQRAIRHFVTRDKPIILVQLGKIKRMPMMIENLPMLRFDTGDPIRSFSKILEEIRKLNLNDYE